VEELIGKDNICENVQAAVARAQDVFEGMESKAAVGPK
jgi:hypothetical protein